MAADGISPGLLQAWLAGRSLARQLPPPVAAGSGFRVDTNSDAELRRWIFPAADPQIATVARTIANPREPIKACIAVPALASLLPSHWDVQESGYFMRSRGSAAAATVPDGFVTRVEDRGSAGMVEIVTDAGELTARGHWGRTANAFVYDRLVVEPAFRRRGLGRSLMGLIGQFRSGEAAPQLLVATDAGRLLYMALGWEVLSPYSTAFWYSPPLLFKGGDQEVVSSPRESPHANTTPTPSSKEEGALCVNGFLPRFEVAWRPA